MIYSGWRSKTVVRKLPGSDPRAAVMKQIFSARYSTSHSQRELGNVCYGRELSVRQKSHQSSKPFRLEIV